MSIYYLVNDTNFGFFKIDGGGWGKITNNYKNATKLKLNEYYGNKYFTVGDGDWDGYYIGYLDVNNTYVCCTKNWNLARYIEIKDNKIKFKGADGISNWKIYKDNSNNEVRIGNLNNFDIAIFGEYIHKDINLEKIEYWKFIKKMNEKTKTKRYVKKIHVFEINKKIDISLKYEISLEASIPIEDILTASGKSNQSYEFKSSTEIKNSETTEEYFETESEFTGDLNVWYHITRFKLGENYIDKVFDVSYVKDKENPGFSENTLVEVDERGIIKFKDINKK